jgi:hypothetical protein
MKDEPIFYVGLDVHQSTTVVCVCDEHSGVRMRATERTGDRSSDLRPSVSGWSGDWELVRGSRTDLRSSSEQVKPLRHGKRCRVAVLSAARPRFFSDGLHIG